MLNCCALTPEPRGRTRALCSGLRGFLGGVSSVVYFGNLFVWFLRGMVSNSSAEMASDPLEINRSCVRETLPSNGSGLVTSESSAIT